MSNQQLVEHVWGWNSGIWGPTVGAAIFTVWQVIFSVPQFPHL